MLCQDPALSCGRAKLFNVELRLEQGAVEKLANKNTNLSLVVLLGIMILPARLQSALLLIIELTNIR